MITGTLSQKPMAEGNGERIK